MIRTLALAATCGLAAATADVGGSDYFDTIRATFDEREESADETMFGVNSCSYDTDSNKCPMSDMTVDETTLVYPGGDTRCIYSNSGDFAFQVIPGDSDKLLLFFQGGGACWDELSTKAGACSSTPVPAGQTGVFDRDNDENPFKDHTVVHVLYCSGDLHAGNVTRDYNDRKGVPVEQRGFYNTRASVDWALANLDDKLSSLVVSGCSAGSLGTQAWAGELLKEFEYESAAVVPDSYAGIFPNGTMEVLIPEFGMCDVGILEGDILDSCRAETLTVQDVFDDAMKTYPNTAFANLNSEFDSTQMGFYAGIAATMHKLPLTLSSDEYADELNKVLKRYDENANYVSYVVTSSQHCYTPSKITYSADTTGKSGGGAGGQTMLKDWLAEFPVQSGASVETECDGTLLDQPDWTGDDYCDASQAGKVFTAA